MSRAVGLIKVSFSTSLPPPPPLPSAGGAYSLIVRLEAGSMLAIFPIPSAIQSWPLDESIAIPSGLELGVGKESEFVKLSNLGSNIKTSPVDGDVIQTVGELPPNWSTVLLSLAKVPLIDAFRSDVSPIAALGLLPLLPLIEIQHSVCNRRWNYTIIGEPI